MRKRSVLGPSGAPIVVEEIPQARLVAPARDVRRVPRRLLIAFLHGLGDNLMLTPVVRALAAVLPNTELVLLVRGDLPVAELWEDASYLHAVARYVGPIPAYWNPAHQAGPAQRLRRALREAASTCGADALAHVTGMEWPTPVMRAVGLPHKQRVFERQLGVRPASYAYDLRLREEHRVAASALFPPEAPPTVALNRTASQAHRYWSVDAYEATARSLRSQGYRVLHAFVSGSRALERAAAGRRHAERLAGDVSLEDLADRRFLTAAAAVERCVAVVSVDSALMHVGLALGLPTVGLFTWPILMRGNVFESNLAIVRGQPSADVVLAALERARGGAHARAVSAR